LTREGASAACKAARISRSSAKFLFFPFWRNFVKPLQEFHIGALELKNGERNRIPVTPAMAVGFTERNLLAERIDMFPGSGSVN